MPWIRRLHVEASTLGRDQGGVDPVELVVRDDERGDPGLGDLGAGRQGRGLDRGGKRDRLAVGGRRRARRQAARRAAAGRGRRATPDASGDRPGPDEERPARPVGVEAALPAAGRRLSARRPGRALRVSAAWSRNDRVWTPTTLPTSATIIDVVGVAAGDPSEAANRRGRSAEAGRAASERPAVRDDPEERADQRRDDEDQRPRGRACRSSRTGRRRSPWRRAVDGR